MRYKTYTMARRWPDGVARYTWAGSGEVRLRTIYNMTQMPDNIKLLYLKIIEYENNQIK